MSSISSSVPQYGVAGQLSPEARPASDPAALPSRTASQLHDSQAPSSTFRGHAGLDGYLADLLRPPRPDPDLLAPAPFFAALAGARDQLERAAADQPQDATALNRAARLMGDELELRGLMTLYRSALLQG